MSSCGPGGTATIKPKTVPIEISSDRGAQLSDCRLREARVADPDLLALDVRRSAGLEVLDLSDCGHDLRVTVRESPSLRELRLPADGPGATLHLDFGPQLPNLVASGAIAYADLCWDDEDAYDYGSFREEMHHGLAPVRGRNRRQPLQGLVIGRPSTPIPDDVEFVMLFEGPGPRALTLPGSVRELLIQAAPGVETLCADPPGAALVAELRELPDLVSVAGRAKARLLRITAAPSLEKVTWTGGRIHLTGSGSRLLTLPAPWDSVELVDSSTHELRARYSDWVRLQNCADLQILVASPEGELVLFDPPGMKIIDGPRRIRLERVSPRQILTNALGGTEFERDLALQWVATRVRPSERVEALEVLHAAATKGWNPARLWELRCNMHTSGAEPGGPIDDGMSWSWVLPDDLAARGWEADLRLWRICKDAATASPFPPPIPDPREFAYVIGGSTEPPHLAALAVTTAREHVAGRPCADLVELLRSSLEAGREARVLGKIRLTGGPRGRQRQEAARALSFDQVRAALQALVAMRTHPEASELAGMLSRWIAQRMPYTQGVDLLGALRDLGCEEATRHLAGFASDRSDEPRKQHAMALLMKAPTHATFASRNDPASPAHALEETP